MGAEVALVVVIRELNAQMPGWRKSLAERFKRHPDAKVIPSLPGLEERVTRGPDLMRVYG